MPQTPQDHRLVAVARSEEPCKICGAASPLWGVADFNKNCMSHRGVNLPVAGIPVYYHRCPACSLIFTTAFDHFTRDDFKRHIYNDQYITVDPEYIDKRPITNATTVVRMFEQTKSIRILDYGGGNGKTAELLRAAGFTNLVLYDPFVESASSRPHGKFDLVLSFEVAEHSPRPRETFADMVSFLGDDGLLMFSTLVQPKEIEQAGMNWWYIAPRNGHVTIYSTAALRRIADAMGYHVASVGPAGHMMFKTIPPFARHIVKAV